MSELTWTCHICGDERPDRFISVFSKPAHFAGGVVAQTNIRYCNDKDSCVEAAPTFELFKARDYSKPPTEQPDPPPPDTNPAGRGWEQVAVIVLALGIIAVIAILLATQLP